MVVSYYLSWTVYVSLQNFLGDKPLKKSASEKPEKSKSGKAKVPLDLDRHCGVPLGTGVCMRAITCKNHSVAAKRAVEGRSQGYDILVQLYQSRMAQEKKDRLAAQEAANTKVESPQQVIQLETLDPDTEAVAVYEAIKFYQATPLATKPRSLVKHRHMSSSIETLREALAKKSVKVSAG
ncbi:SCA7, zinc-binding domain-containing protein [Paraphysoderma sedebokerense]|nr:SCA7, zinc-binding domain-containing protein [Paraphysoderma sedebokerense]